MQTERLDRKELKRAAKGIIAEAQPGPVRATMFYLLILTGVTIGMNIVLALTARMRGESLFDPLGMFFNILIILFEWVLSFGYIRYGLHLADRTEAGRGEVLSGFSETGRVILMSLIVFGFGMLWYLAILAAAVAPIFVVSLMSGLALSGLALSGLGEGAIMAATYVIVGVFVAIILVALFLLMVRYALASYILADDGAISPLNAVRRSRLLLRGRNKEMFFLQLSFLGWNLLSILIYVALSYAGGKVADTTGLWWMRTVFSSLGSLAQIPLLLWLQPYMTTTYALYYRLRAPRPETAAVSAPLPEADTPWRAGD